MATLTPIIFHNSPVKADGTFDVKIRISHKTKNAYTATPFTVGKKDLLNGKIKQQFIIREMSKELDRLTNKLEQIKHTLDKMTAQDIKLYLMSPEENIIGHIDFLDFATEQINALRQVGRTSSARTYATAANSLKDYLSTTILEPKDITKSFLEGFESFLRKPRVITRVNQGKNKTYPIPGLEGTSLHNIFRDVRSLFNKCKEQYNDEDRGIIPIPNNPFGRYKLPKVKPSGDRDLTPDDIRRVFSCPADPDSRKELARDLAKLSFLLCGMNAKDIYEAAHTSTDRITYNRAKTKGRRPDSALISIKIPSEARILFDKYVGKLGKRYHSIATLNKALSLGMAVIGKSLGIEKLQFIRFRHSFASIARNECRKSKDDIAMAMNHVDASNRVTDIYIRKDWKIIDDVQQAVIDYMFGDVLTRAG